MDMLMSQMTGMAMMKDNINLQSLLWTMFVVLFLQRAMGYIPKVAEYVTKKFEEYMKQRTNEMIQTQIGITDETEKSSIIYTRVYNEDPMKAKTKSPRDFIVADAIIDCACKNDNAISLRSNGMYYVNHDNKIYIGDGIYFKLIETVLGENKTVIQITIKIFSYIHTLTQLRRKIEHIYETYQAEIQNELGEKLYYFEDIPISIPKTLDMKTQKESIRYELAPKQIQFRMNPFYTSKRLDNVYGNAMKIVRSRIQFFNENREWYDSRGIPYTLGLLLYGPPGCGKTSLIKAIANECNRHVFSVRLNDHTTRSQLTDLFFSDVINETSNGKTRGLSIPMKKRLLVFEDVDTMCDAVRTRINEETVIENTGESSPEAEAGAGVGVTDGAEAGLSVLDGTIDHSFNVKVPAWTLHQDKIKDLPMFTPMNGLQSANGDRFASAKHNEDPLSGDSGNGTSEKLDLGTLLNLLDGILETPGRIMIMTSNHPETLDPALIRPGRIDLIIKFDKSTKPEVQEIYHGLTGKDISPDILRNIPDKKFTPAKITQSIFENFNDPEQGIRKLSSMA